MTRREEYFHVTVLVVVAVGFAYAGVYLFNHFMIDNTAWFSDVVYWVAEGFGLPPIVVVLPVYALIIAAYCYAAYLIMRFCVLPRDSAHRAAIHFRWKDFKRRHIVDNDPYDKPDFGGWQTPRLPKARGHKQKRITH
jgi:hypothetical protein